VKTMNSIYTTKAGWGSMFSIVALFFTSCATKRGITTGAVGTMFSLTNSVMEDAPVQVVKSTFGLSMLPRRTDLTIQFGTNACLFITFDRATLKPDSIMLDTGGSNGNAGQIVFDKNADGIPDERKIKGEEGRQIFYMCDWHDRRQDGTNCIIDYDGKPLRLFFDGAAWRPSTNQEMTPNHAPKPEAESARNVNLHVSTTP